MDHTTEFFERLGSQPQPLLAGITGTMRVDVDDRGSTRHWYLDIDKSTVAVSSRDADADAIVRVHRSVFDRVITGEANALAATLRGQLTVEGDPRLMVAFQRIMPGPPKAAKTPTSTKGSAR